LIRPALSFSAPVLSPVGSATVIATGDFTSDGRPDLLARGANDSLVRLFKGNGDGSFGSPGVAIQAGFNVTSIVVADFNRDGNLDFAAANNSGMLTVLSSVTILLGRGNGTFVQASTPFPGANPNALAVADFNRDGIADLVSANDLQWTPPGSLAPPSFGAGVLLGNGDGTFKPVQKIYLTGPQTHVAVGDINGDGWADAAFAGPNLLTASPLPISDVTAAINANGGFKTVRVAGVLGSVSGLAARDVTRDGAADIEVVQTFARSNSTTPVVPGDTTLQFYLSRPTTSTDVDGSFVAGRAVDLPMVRAAGLSAADFDLDGRIDFAVAGTDARPTPADIPLGGIVAVVLGKPLSTTTAPPIFRAGPAPLSQTVDDLNSDGRPDILTGNASGVAALLNTTRPITAASLDATVINDVEL
jgi:hypothetical protein